jgi:hypothetical protein
MHVKDMQYDFLEELENMIEEVLKNKDRVLISVVGRGGTGKSYFGKYVRSRGLGTFSRRVIAVIDDRLMKLDFLFYFQRRIKIPRKGLDELQPFIKKMPKRKKIIFFINATPWERITEADILLKLSTDEETRRQRLHQRYGSNSPETLKRILNADEISEYHITYSYFLEASV